MHFSYSLLCSLEQFLTNIITLGPTKKGPPLVVTILPTQIDVSPQTSRMHEPQATPYERFSYR